MPTYYSYIALHSSLFLFSISMNPENSRVTLRHQAMFLGYGNCNILIRATLNAFQDLEINNL